ncbi:MAG: HAMP domain-containing protein, partial [Acidobacteria bacterium]|nr:HAMP domain-containing protein [Acidobacteriota bacterium]
FGVLLVFLSIGLFRTSSLRLNQQVNADLQARAAAIRPLISVAGSSVNWLGGKEFVDQSSGSTFYVIYDNRGAFVEGSAGARLYNLGFSAAAAAAISTRQPTWETVSNHNSSGIRCLNNVITGTDGKSYVLRVAAPLDQIHEELQLLITSILALLPLVLLSGGLAGWWLAGRALAPVSEITALAGRISVSHLGERLPLRGTGDELDQLSAQLNRMIARLQYSFEQMSQFLSNVSHELRTPLAALRGRSEMAVRNAKTVEEFRTIVSGNIEVHQRMAETISDLLALARAEAGQTVLNHRSENLSELLRDVVESTRPLADTNGVTLRFRANSEIHAEVDPTHVMRLVINLVDNAIKYNKKGGGVDVLLDTADGYALLSVTDTGIGIAAEDLPHIFDRFFRGDPDNSNGTGGTGLGLGLARWVANAHGGKIEVESQLGAGSCFKVWLPLNKSEVSPEARSRVWVLESSENRNIDQDMELFERSDAMWKQVVVGSYWLGIVSGAVALFWRSIVALGLPDTFYYGADRGVGYEGFLKGALLFLLVSCATRGYAATSKE